MPRIVKGGLIQATLSMSTEQPIEKIKQSMIEKHLKMIHEAAKKGVQILCLQELFYGPYFCAEQETKWYEMVEKVPDGPTVKLMQEEAKKHGMVIIVPVYEEEITGVYYNTAAVIDADGKYSRQVSETSYSALQSGILGKILFQTG